MTAPLTRTGARAALGWCLPAAIVTVALIAPACRPPSGAPEAPIYRPDPAASLDSELATRIEVLARSIGADPGNAELRAELGMLYEANGLHDLAATTYEQALVDREGEPRIQFRLAQARYRAGDLEGAIEAMEKVVEISDYEPAAARLAGWLLDAGRLEEAERRVAALDAADGDEALYVRARVLLAGGEAGDAIELLEGSSLVAGPNAPHARHLLARCLRAAGRLEEAAGLSIPTGVRRPVFEDPWSRVLAEHRVVGASELRLAGSHLENARYPEALEILEGLAAQSPDDRRVFNMLADGYAQSGRLPEAREALASAIVIAPRHVDSRLNYANVLLRSSLAEPAFLEAALEHVDVAIALDPALGAAHQLRGAVLISLDRPAEAVAALETAWELDARDPTPLLRAGARLIRKRQWDAGTSVFELVLATDPEQVGALLGLARCAMEVGRFPDAEALLEQVAEIAPAAAQLRAARTRLEELRG